MNAIVEKDSQLPVAEAGQPNMVAFIERIIRDPQIDVLKIEQLMNMQERLIKRDAELAYNSALSKAQAAIGRIATDKNNSSTRSSYASYAALDRVVRPIYTENGFSLSFDTGETPLEHHIRLLCHVSHSSGHTRTYHFDIPADGKGAKGGDVMTKTHAAGSGVSYAMRYLLKMIFNIAIGEDPDDDDGNSAGDTNPHKDKPQPPKLTPEHLASIRTLCKTANVAEGTICKTYKVGVLEDFPDSAYTAIANRLDLSIKANEDKARLKVGAAHD